jgi:PUB domain
MYNDFLTMAKSGQRPVVFEVRRVETKTQIQKDTKSADEYARKQAVIAAAEAREKAHKAKTKPVKMGEKKLPVILSAAEKRQQELERERDAQLRQQEAPRTEEARRAMEAAKRNEAELANQLGYNPYETNKATAGQARNATVAVQHGTVGGGGKAKSNPESIPSVRPPADPTSPAQDDGPNQSTATEDAKILAKCPEFYETYTTVVTANADNSAVVKSFGIMRTLVKNATTKGQNTENGEDAASKFRRVRLGNAKIKAAILDVTGALELMMLFGFQLSEEDGESVLVFPYGDTGPDFLPAAMRQLERYENESS